MKNTDHTRYDLIVRWIKNNPFVSILVFIGVVIIALNSFTDSVKNLTKQISEIFSKEDIKIGAAMYAYERAFVFDGKKKTYYYEMRNLATNCSLWRAEANFPRGRSITPTPEAKVILKFLLKNASKISLSNLRIGLSGLPYQFDKILCTPNIECSMKHETTSNEALGTRVILMPTIAPAGEAVVSLEAPVDKGTYKKLVGVRLTILLPFVTSDQLVLSQPKASKLNAMELVKKESELFGGKRTFANEKITYRLLCPGEPDVVEPTHDPLPPAKQCATGTGGNW